LLNRNYEYNIFVKLSFKYIMKILSVLGLLVCLFSCNSNANVENQNINDEDVSSIVTKSDISNLDFVEFILDNKSEKHIENWEKYFELDVHVINVKQADLSFFKNNNEMLVAFIQDIKSTLPESINSKPILARMTALETKMYKLESSVNLSNVHRNDIISAIKEFLISYSNLNFQINKKFEREAQNIQKPQ